MLVVADSSSSSSQKSISYRKASHDVNGSRTGNRVIAFLNCIVPNSLAALECRDIYNINVLF